MKLVHQTLGIACVFLLAVLFSACQQSEQEAPHPTVMRVGVSPAEGSVAAAVVGDHPLAHTAQVLPYDRQGKLVGEGNLGRQITQVLANLGAALNPVGSGLDNLMRINVYAKSNEIAQRVRKHFSTRFSGESKPTVSYVVTNLPHDRAQVAMDAVGTIPENRSYDQTQHVYVSDSYRLNNYSDVGIMPATNRVYFSGRVVGKGPLKKATKITMEEHQKSLKYMNLDWSDVVQLKAFIHPIADRDLVAETMASFFKENRAPTMVFVEWYDDSYLPYFSLDEEDGLLPIEIELLAARPADSEPLAEPGQQRVTYHTQPWLSAPDTYSRVAEQHHGGVLYTSSLYGTGANARDELRDIYSDLGTILKKTGSNFENLTKATYYVTDKPSTEALNEIRTDFYNPNRAPTSSKIAVRAVGKKGRSVTFDIIGTVPSEAAP